MHLKTFPFIIPIGVGVIIQVIKIGIDMYRGKPLFRTSIFTAGWFPSVHSGLAASISTLVFLEQGAESLLFAISFCYTVIIAFDAMNVRYEAWKHAKYLNNMRTELKEVLHNANATHVDILKERIGHTPREVVGGLICGILLTILLYQL